MDAIDTMAVDVRRMGCGWAMDRLWMCHRYDDSMDNTIGIKPLETNYFKLKLGIHTDFHRKRPNSDLTIALRALRTLPVVMHMEGTPSDIARDIGHSVAAQCDTEPIN